jgi:predicted O-methyltransferase YrrM
MALLPPDPLCVNIGAAMGTSTLAMLEARNDATVVSIDIEECPIEKEALEQSGIDYENRYLFVHGMSQHIGVTWTPLVDFDFVFVDGDHTYDGCYQDGATWCLHLNPGGYIAFHDYGDVRPTLEGVKRATDEVAEMFSLELVEHVGTLIVFRKPNEDLPH